MVRRHAVVHLDLQHLLLVLRWAVVEHLLVELSL